MIRCKYRLEPKNDDGTYIAICSTHHGLMWQYGDPEVIRYHRCPMGLAEDAANREPPDYTAFYANQAKIKNGVWVENDKPRMVVVPLNPQSPNALTPPKVKARGL